MTFLTEKYYNALVSGAAGAVETSHRKAKNQLSDTGLYVKEHVSSLCIFSCFITSSLSLAVPFRGILRQAQDDILVRGNNKISLYLVGARPVPAPLEVRLQQGCPQLAQRSVFLRLRFK